MKEQEKLELLKAMAMADGVLSENEKKVFRETTNLSESDLQVLFDDIESDLECVQSETEIIDWKHKNGIDFEKYIVNLLPDNYSNLQWTGDKFVDGRFDEKNKQPDIIFDVCLNQVYSVAIECKFRMSYFNDLIFIAKDEQLERYKDFEKQNHIPVYIALGVGGSGAHPEELYLIPVSRIKYKFATKEYLKNFVRVVDKKFFYHVKSKTLF